MGNWLFGGSNNDIEIKEGLVFGLGNPLLDISANCEPEMLQKYGLWPNDQILAEDKHKDLCKEMVETLKVQYFAGGSVQNSLRVMQWFFSTKPNVGTYMGCIGDDDFGRRMKDKANEDRINVVYMVHKTEQTGTCACLITNEGKNRSLVAYLGASEKFDIKHLLDNYKCVENAKYVLSSGYHLGVSYESVLNLAKHCTESKGKVFLFSLSAPFVCTKYSKELLKVYPFIDYLFGNESEAREFSDMMGWDASELIEIVQLMADKDPKKSGRKVIVTQGTGPILLGITGNAVQEFESTKLPQHQVIDTNGAGDAFLGGFVAQLIQRKPIDVCIKSGNYAASEVIQQSGCCFPKQNNFQTLPQI